MLRGVGGDGAPVRAGSAMPGEIVGDGVDAMPHALDGFLKLATRGVKTLRPILDLQIGGQRHMLEVAGNGRLPCIKGWLDAGGHGVTASSFVHQSERRGALFPVRRGKLITCDSGRASGEDQDRATP